MNFLVPYLSKFKQQNTYAHFKAMKKIIPLFHIHFQL